METEIIQTDNPDIVIERTTTEVEIDTRFLREELDGNLLLVAEQEDMQKRLYEKMDNMDDEELKLIIQEKINKVEEDKRRALIKIADLSNKLK